MKKIIITLGITILITLTHAEYKMIIPLEQSKGGSLPNGSINLNIKQTTTPVIPEKNECLYLGSSNQWLSIENSYIHIFWRNGESIDVDMQVPYGTEFYTSGKSDYLYFRGGLMNDYGTMKIYEICRKKLN